MRINSRAIKLVACLFLSGTVAGVDGHGSKDASVPPGHGSHPPAVEGNMSIGGVLPGKFAKVINTESMGWDIYKPFVALVDAYGSMYCSGSVIGDYAILTAGHCLIDDTPLVARFNDDSADMPLTSSMYHVHDRFYDGDFNHDVGVIVTKKKIPSSAGRGRVVEGKLAVGDTVFAFGVGDMIEDVTEWDKLTGMIPGYSRGFGDFFDWVVDGVADFADGVVDVVSDAADWVGDVVFGDDAAYESYDVWYDYDNGGTAAYDGDYHEEYHGDYGNYGEYSFTGYDYMYDDLIAGENEVAMSDVPRVAVMTYTTDDGCFLSEGQESTGLLCTVSETQNTCNGDSGGPVVDRYGYIVGLTSLGSPGCDRSPNGVYESFAVDVSWSGNSEFIRGLAGRGAYDTHPVDPIVLPGVMGPGDDAGGAGRVPDTTDGGDVVFSAGGGCMTGGRMYMLGAFVVGLVLV